MKILEHNIPATLKNQQEALKACLKAFSAVFPIEQVILFGSHSRGRALAHSDVDLCIVARGFDSQWRAACAFRKAIGRLRNKPPLSIIPVSPQGLEEKQRNHDPFFETILREGICIAEKD